MVHTVCSTLSLRSLNILHMSSLESLSGRLNRWLVLVGCSELLFHSLNMVEIFIVSHCHLFMCCVGVQWLEEMHDTEMPCLFDLVSPPRSPFCGMASPISSFYFLRHCGSHILDAQIIFIRNGFSFKNALLNKRKKLCLHLYYLILFLYLSLKINNFSVCVYVNIIHCPLLLKTEGLTLEYYWKYIRLCLMSLCHTNPM